MAPDNTEQSTPTDEGILADPAAYTVEQVLEVFDRSTPDQVAAAKLLEAEGKNRAGIANFEPASDLPDAPPEPELPPAAPEEPTFSVARLLGSEGTAITGVDGPTLVGALYGEDESAEFTREQVEALVEAFHTRPVQQEG